MTDILIYEPALISRRGHNGFFSYFLSALVEYAGAHPIDAPRPTPQMTAPRLHESCWVRFGDRLVFFDMSDHIQLLDLGALRTADVYFKANLHRGVARRVLDAAGLIALEDRLRPFLFFSDQLDWFLRARRWGGGMASLLGRFDVAHIVGVYENLVRDGASSPFEHWEGEPPPGSYHFWVRYHAQQALKDTGLSGNYRLTSRGNRALEDGKTVCSNLSRRAFALQLLRSRAVVVSTLPHALFPWKVSESLALGRPVVLDVEPITEVPEPFRLERGTHYLTLFDEPVGVSTDAPLDAPAAYRALPAFSLPDFEAAAERVAALLRDRVQMAEMGEACLSFARQAYTKERVAGYILDTVAGTTGGT